MNGNIRNVNLSVGGKENLEEEQEDCEGKV